MSPEKGRQTESISKESACQQTPWTSMFIRKPDRHTGPEILKATTYKGGIVNVAVALATAKALVERYPLSEKDKIVSGKPWPKSLSQHIDFVRGRKTTCIVLILAGARKEVALKFLHQIVSYVENYQILTSLIITFEQTQRTFKFHQKRRKRMKQLMFLYQL